jgi:ribosomal subunit interface protein
MDVVLKARGEKLTGAARERVERKLSRLERFDGRLDRVELEVIRETRGRIGGGHRVEASARSGRVVFRASATGNDVESAVDRLVRRLERQISEKRGKRKSRLLAWTSRVQSRRSPPSTPE